MNTEEQLINTPIEKFDAVYFFIFHLLQKSLDDRSRNTLISGIVPKSSEIKSMYEMNQNKQKLLIYKIKSGYIDKFEGFSLSKIRTRISFISSNVGYQLRGALGKVEQSCRCNV